MEHALPLIVIIPFLAFFIKIILKAALKDLRNKHSNSSHNSPLQFPHQLRLDPLDLHWERVDQIQHKSADLWFIAYVEHSGKVYCLCLTSKIQTSSHTEKKVDLCQAPSQHPKTWLRSWNVFGWKDLQLITFQLCSVTSVHLSFPPFRPFHWISSPEENYTIAIASSQPQTCSRWQHNSLRNLPYLVVSQQILLMPVPFCRSWSLHA